MKKTMLALASVAILFSCKKNDDDDQPITPPGPSGPNVTAASLTGSLNASSTLYFYFVNSNGGGAITVPQAGTGQTWNYSTVTAASADTMTLGPVNNAAFPTANFARTQSRNVSVGAVSQMVNITNYFEISNSGWFNLGERLPAMTFTIPGTGTLSYAAQNDPYTPKLPMTPPFPIYLNDSINYSSVLQETSSVTAAPLLNNAPTVTKYTYAGTIKAIATGKVSLPGFTAPLDAMVIRRDQNVTLNFLLNGVTPPASLLTQLGIQDGQTTSTTYYDFYNYGGIGYLGYVAVQNNAVIGAYFRKP